MVKKQVNRKNVEKQGKIDEKKPPKYKTLEDAYGKNKISDQIKILESIIIENKQSIKYCFTPNEELQRSELKKFNWSQLAA